MEIIENFYVEKQPTIKQLYKAHLGQPISNDYFLFHCLKEEVSQRALMDEKVWERRAPLLKQEAALEFNPAAIQEIFTWYKKEFPTLAYDGELDYNSFSELVFGFILLVMDIEALAAKTKSSLSLKDNQALVMQVADSLFPNLSARMKSFFSWRFQDEKQTEIDINSIPPVGRFIPMLRQYVRNMYRKKQQADFASNSPGQRRPSSSPPHRSESNGSYSTQRNQGTRQRSEHGQDKRFGKKEGTDTAAQEQAINEAKKAVETLRSDSQLQEMKLKPQNSFVRRLQHQVVVEAGFNTESAGEGQDRFVLIRRT